VPGKRHPGTHVRWKPKGSRGRLHGRFADGDRIRSRVGSSQSLRVRNACTGVRQNNAIDYRVNESHLLSLKRSRREGGHQKGAVLNISVKDYLEKSAKFQSNYKGYKVAVDFEEKPLPIDPYFLGIWLGDGRKDDIRIANQDEEVISFLRDDAANLDMKLSTYEHPKKVAMHAIVAGPIGHKGDSLQAQLRALDLLNHKNIPRTYLINSRSQRLQLLAGLIDSDGHYYKKHNGYEISQKDEALARQIKFLCDTLGFRTSLRKKKAGIAAIGYESEAWRVRFSGSIEEIPVRIPRKQGKPYTKNRDWRVTGIQVEYDKVDTYYGFELEGPDGLFCLEDLTVTHNTALTLTLARNAALRFNTPVALFSLEMAGVQLTQRLLTGEAELDAQKVRTGRLEDYEWKQLITRIGGLSKAPIYIDDTPGLSITDLRAKARRLKAEKDIGMLIIDYLQLMSGNVSKGGNREQEIAGISRSLKIIAKELDVCVIALSQLSRAVESRGGDKRPVLSDLRESGCLTGDTLVLDAQTGARIPIKELAERPWKEEMKTPGVDAGWKVGEQQMVKAFYSGKKKVFELETWSGRKIKASANHPFLKLNGWTRLDQLNAGDAIAIPRKLSFSQPSNPMKAEELILLAHLLGDGCILPRQPYHYTSNDEANLQVVAETAKQLFGIEPRKVAQKNWWHLYLPSPYHLTHGKKHPITNWYEHLGLERVRAKDKQLPDALFRCDEERVGLFLHHLWATDGNLSWKKLPGRKDAGVIYYASTSEKLVEQVQHLLLRLGIVASIRKSIKKAYKASFQVHIQGAEDQLLFLEKVGCFGRRGEIADALKASLDQVHPNPNSGTIPADAWRTVIQQEKERIGISWREFAKRLGTSYGGTTLFKRGISRQRMARIAQALEGSEKIQNLAESHVYWDTIKQITPLGIEDVYDATVLDVHNFVANDIIVHNSIEQDADMVAFLYRPEYYGFETDEEGNSTQGLAELIIAKQRNGPTGTVKLQFIGKYGKFSDWGYNTNSDIESAYGQLGGTPAGAGGNTITLPSKLNEDPAQGGQGNDMDVPF
jgi:replicative DNA helicase